MKKQISTFGLILLTITLFSFISDTSERPQPNLNGITGDNLSLSTLETLDRLVIQLDRKDFDVISYRLVIAPQNDYAYMSNHNGNAISEYEKGKLLNCTIGDRFLLDKVIAQNKHGLKTLCQPLMITFVE